MPPSCVDSGNENVTEGEPKGENRESRCRPLLPALGQETWTRSPPNSRCNPPGHVRQTNDAGLAKRLRLGSHHRLPLNHLSAEASSRKLWTLTPCWRPINSMY